MGVYIKGMEMPRKCIRCPVNLYGRCLVNDDKDVSEATACAVRDKDCPLIPVPEHGRLGDLDELYKEAVRRAEKTGTYDSWYNCMDRVISAFDIKNAPTIISADCTKEES